jgi:hypothetical protein
VTKPIQEPGPGRSTSDAAFTALTKEIAQRNDRAQTTGRKLRAVREQEQAHRRRQEDDAQSPTPESARPRQDR